MLNSKELRVRAWNSLKGKYWKAFAVVLVLGILASIGTSMVTTSQELMSVLKMVDPSEMDSTMQLGATVVIGIASVLAIVGLLISIFVGDPATVGLCNYFIKNTDSKPSFKDAFSGFKVRYGRNIGTLLLVGIKLTLWYILLIIPGIIKSFEYAIIPYILADDPEISSKEAFKKANQMMKGNKWRLFCLSWSFIGWDILAFFTLGLGHIVLCPYVEAACAAFYRELKANN